jgi:signal transduction histidine kinase
MLRAMPLRAAFPLSGLSARLLVLTIAFVMLAEVLIYVPSIARFRQVYLEERLAAAHLASLALDAAPNQPISATLSNKLLEQAMVRIVSIKRKDARSLYLGDDMPPPVHASFDLRDPSWYRLAADAFATLMINQKRVISVAGNVPGAVGDTIDVILDEYPMQQAMRDFSIRILSLSIFISVITAGLVFLSLQWLMVRPMRRITQSMVAFRNAPEDSTVAPEISTRSDEIGVAQRELADMQVNLRAALRQRSHLAALGAAVSKINHDLRNILATAQLVSDRFSDSADPEVRRIAPTLVRSIDRAIALCTNSLRYGRGDDAVLDRQSFDLADLASDVRAALALPDGVEFRNDVAADFTIVGDREQMFRVLLNLTRNAAEAMTGFATGSIAIRAARTAAAATIEVADTGPGIPEAARLHMFEPFKGAARSGGTGLGLAIARDIMHAHGGEIELAGSGPTGTVFRLTLPDRAAALDRRTANRR